MTVRESDVKRDSMQGTNQATIELVIQPFWRRRLEVRLTKETALSIDIRSRPNLGSSDRNRQTQSDPTITIRTS